MLGGAAFCVGCALDAEQYAVAAHGLALELAADPGVGGLEFIVAVRAMARHIAEPARC